jgi:hypothetical protein
VVVKVVTEGLNVRDDLFSSLSGEMTREEHYFVSLCTGFSCKLDIPKVM